MQETDFKEKDKMQNLCATNGGTEQCCGEHRRRLELFCQEDEAFICVLCVPRHSYHSFVFLHEAVRLYKDKLKTSLSSLELKVRDLKDLQTKNEREFLEMHDKLKTSLLSLELKVRDLKDLQTKNETEFLEVQEHAVNLEKFIAEEFVKLHQFLHDKEQKLIQQLNSKASEILKDLEEHLECIKTGVMEIYSAVFDTNLEIKTEVEVLEETNDDTDCLTTTEESVSGDTSEHGKHKANGVLSAPESFEDVAVTFSAEEMKMLTKQDKELHKEVMLENYETLVSAGYKIPREALLMLLKEDNDELPVNVEGINRTEHKNNFKEKPDSNGSREWSICGNQQPSLGVSMLHYPTENLQHSIQNLKGSDKHLVTSVAQFPPGYTCNMNSECDRSSIVQKIPLVHQRAHKENKPYKCPECNKCFRQSSDQVKHERTHTGVRPYKCPECNKSFKQGSHLVNHKRTHMGERPYECPECSMCFRKRGELVIHERIHSGERPYTCTECKKCFRKKGELVIHERIHTGERPYKCSECNKCFKQGSHLADHRRTHMGDRPYKCAECSKRFRRSSTLKVHLLVHKGEKPYKCPECSKCFRQRSALVRHERTHTGERPYKCSECSKCFRQKSDLAKHERTHMGDRESPNGEIKSQQAKESSSAEVEFILKSW
ncbi:zinc finger protein 19-like [Protopterus annectens]|uniref:zinc finger protein 19-like n=1 Tax=Protopterus annectens TaxID=7888 RepID=UPI001CFB0835|nr:zinc finger protein 19-like [Protopterus annectens]